MGSLELSNPGLTPEELDSIRSNRRRLWIAIGLILLFFLLAFAGWVAWKLTATGADHYTRALSQSEAGNFSSAVIELKNALTENPDDTAARLLLGSLYVELGDGNSARKEYEIAAALGADAELSKLGLLRARFLQGGRREVISGLDGLASTHREAALLRGDVLTALGRLEPAEVAFTTLLDSNPKDIKALHGLARIGLERGDFDFAKKTLETAQSLSTVSVTGWLLQADVAFRTQEFGQARLARIELTHTGPPFDETTSDKPTNSSLRHYLSTMLNDCAGIAALAVLAIPRQAETINGLLIRQQGRFSQR